jgi:RNA polymerase sigma-70 factor (sigma-E family)
VTVADHGSLTVTFTEFVDARLRALLRYATVVTCDPDLAEDVVQEVLLRAQQRWERISRTEQPEAYVKRMVLNEFLSWRRRLASRVLPLRDEVLSRATPSVTDPSGQVVERDRMLTLIAALPPKQRAVIALRYYDDLSDAEIAAMLDCRRTTVRSHASRALATLRSGMEEPGPDATGLRRAALMEGEA